MNLFNLTVDLNNLLNRSVDENGVLDDKALDLLDEKALALEDKCIAVSKYVRNLEAEAAAVAEASKEMALRCSSLSKRISSLKEYLKENMERCGISEIKCPQFVIKVKKNPTSVEVYNEDILPKEFMKEIIDYRVDKRLIKEALENGRIVAGAGLKQNTRLEIK